MQCQFESPCLRDSAERRTATHGDAAERCAKKYQPLCAGMSAELATLLHDF
jgi:hypothetical protein